MKYQYELSFVGVFLLLTVSIGLCADLGFKSDNEFDEWMTFYYQHPSPNRIPTALVYYCNSPMYISNATIPVEAFFSALFKKDTTSMQKTFDAVSLNNSENAKIMFINILFLTNTSDSKILIKKIQGIWKSDRVQKIITQQMAQSHNDLYAISIDSPLILDMLWTSFFATGDSLPVQRIISVLHLSRDGHGEEIIVGGAAQWSLKSNARQHPKVLEICKKEFLTAKGETKSLLGEIVK